jgi:regulator of sigma E protease
MLVDMLSGFGVRLFTYIVPFLFVLTLVVFIHELGHFLVARWCGVRILTFSIGFGPELFGWNDRRGTRWRVAAVPLGGYVKFFGDESAASTPNVDTLSSLSPAERRVSFHHQPIAARAAIVAAGPIANFLLAIVVFAGVFMFLGRPTTEARVDQVQPGSAAAEAGFQPGDLVLRIDGTKIDSFSDMQRLVSTSADRQLTIEIRRGDRDMTLQATPRAQERTDAFGQTSRLGVLGLTRVTSPDNVHVEKFGPLGAVGAGAQETWFVVTRTLGYLRDVAGGRESIDQLSGPIRIAEVSGEAAKLGFQVLLNLAAVLSVSIGLLNLFPIPLLDGGHLLYYGIEAVRGRPLSDRAQEFGFRVGLAIVFMLMLVATWNDILHLTAL